MSRKSHQTLNEIVENLNNEFKKLDDFTIEDYSDLELSAEKNLNEDELKRFVQMLNHIYK